MSRELTKIVFSRSEFIERDRSIAILRLDMCQHLVGQPVIVRYYVDDEQREIDTLYAIGIRDGVGPECYKVVSLGGLNLVRNVVTELPDISALTHGELYLYQDEGGGWNYVYEVNGTRQIDAIVGGPYCFTNIEDRYRWFYIDKKLKREDDFYSKGEMDKKLALIEGNLLEFEEVIGRLDKLEEEVKLNHDMLVELDCEVFPLSLSIANKTGSLFLTGTEQNVTFQPEVIRKKQDITAECTFTVNGEDTVLNEENQFTITHLTGSRTFKVVATFPVLGITKEASSVVNFGYNFRYGIVPAAWEITEANILSLGNTKLQLKQTTTYTMDLKGQKLAFVCPKVYGKLSHIFDANNFDYIADYDVTEIEVAGYQYYVYLKKSEVTITNFRQVYTY